MNETSRTAFGRWARVALAVVLLAFGASSLAAQQSTGKIEGNVADPTGQPVAGAQVTVIGTSFGALTNESGYFFINNVPAGLYTLRAQFIGYQPAEVQRVRVQGGQTITVNFDLAGAVQLGAITVSVASNPLVPRDQVSSKAIITGDLLQGLPTDNIRNVLAVQPGVVESGRDQGLSIRGGRAGEAAVFVDGALVRSVLDGGSNLNVGTNALEEAAVTTGAIGAEFGDAQSGVISFSTRSGGQSFDGTIAVESDEMFGNAVSAGFNRIEASLSGPLMGNLTFSLASTVQGQQSPFLGKGFENVPVLVPGAEDTVVTDVLETGDSRQVSVPTWVQYSGDCNAAANGGFDCQGRRAPYAWASQATAQAKLQLTYGSGSRISLTGLYSQNQNREWDAGDADPQVDGSDAGTDSYAPQRWDGTRQWSNALILNWTQEVFRSAERALAFDLNVSYQTDKFIQSPMTRDYELNNRDPWGGFGLSPIDFALDFDNFSQDDPTDERTVRTLNSQKDWDLLVDNMRTNQGTRMPFLNQTQYRNTQPYRMNPYALDTGFQNEGYEVLLILEDESRLQGRFNVDWQFDRYNRFKFGADYRTANVNRFATGNVTRTIFADVFTEDPVSAGLYAQDRLDLGDVVIELGVRWDYFDVGALIPRDVARTFTSPDFDEEIRNRNNLYGVFEPMTSHTTLSPRVLVSFPVTDRAGFRLSYSHQVQSPNLQAIMAGVNNDISITNTNDWFPTDVGWGKTIQFEFGGRYAFSQDMVLDIAAYNKDKVSDLTARNLPFFDPVRGDTTRYNVLTNADFGNVRGVDINLTRRFGNFFNGTVVYTFQNAKSTGSDPLTYLNTLGRQTSAITGERVDPPQAILPTDDNRTHNIAGALAFTFPTDFGSGTWYGSVLRDGGIFVFYRFASGLPYTKLRNVGSGQLTPILDFGLGAVADEPINSSTMPWLKFIDLRLTKGFSFGSTDWTLFADFRNVLNLRNVQNLFAETSDVVNGRHREGIVAPAVQRLQGEAGAFLISTTDADGNTIPAVALPGDCGLWQGGAVNCVLLKRAEARYGNGDGLYDENEYTAAFNAYYEVGWGAWRQLGAPRHIRLGFELRF